MSWTVVLLGCVLLMQVVLSLLVLACWSGLHSVRVKLAMLMPEMGKEQ